MFVKRSWNTQTKERYYQYHLAESYRDPETGKNRHRLIMNISQLPLHVIEAIDQSLKQGRAVVGSKVRVEVGDSLRGAGLLAVYRAWKQQAMDEVLDSLTPAQRESVLAMVAQRILEPGSKLALQRQFRDTLLAETWAAKRLDEDELYRVMDALHTHFYSIQEKLHRQQGDSPVLVLYDVTSTYFEGTEAQDGEYGYSRDKRWDRYQIVIGLVCTQAGVPLAVEVWPGSTTDRTTVSERVRTLEERFGITQAVFVGDAGMYTEANSAEIREAGFDYILKPEWRRQRQQLEKRVPSQLELFDRQVVEWVEDGVRYVGCFSECRRERAAARREQGMQTVASELARLASVARKGRYYSWVRLREKVNQLLEEQRVQELWQVSIRPLQEAASPEAKTPLQLEFEEDNEALSLRTALEGKYVLQTSLAPEVYEAEEIEHSYMQLQVVERAFRNIKSYLKLRPIYHYRQRRVRAHVLLCFLAYYLVKKLECELREKGVAQEVTSLLRDWDKLHLVSLTLQAGEHTRQEWQWSLGPVGTEIKEHISGLGWWRSIDAYRRSLIKS